MGRLVDLGVKRTAVELDPLRGELEKILAQAILRNTAKTTFREFGVGDSQSGKKFVSADGASPLTYATRTAATGTDARGIPFTGAKLAGARGRSNAPQAGSEPQSSTAAGYTVGVEQNQAVKQAAIAQEKLTVDVKLSSSLLHDGLLRH